MQAPAEGKRLITLFGGAGIHVGSTPIGGRATHRHPLAIIAYLVANGGRGVTRDKLIALLWPERDADAGRNLLKVNVHELRKELGDAAIRSIGDQLSADLSQLSCDVADFLSAVARGDDEAAVALYRGPFLDGFFLKDSPEFEHWAEMERARLAAMCGAALERLGSHAEIRGDLEAAVKWRRAHALHDPYHADVAHRFVQALAASGDRAGAVQFAESFVERRRRDLDISEDHEIVTLARRLRNVYTPPTPAFTAPMQRPSPIPPIARPASPATRWPWYAMAAALIAAAAFIVARRQGPTNERVAAAQQRIAIFPLRIIGPDSALHAGLPELLAARLGGDGGAVTVQSPRVAQSLDESLTIARQLGATQLLSGEIATAADSSAYAIRLYDAADGKLVAAARADVSRATTVAAVADRLVIELLARAIGEPDDRIAGIIHRPLGAARTYLAAQRAYRSARYVVAESLYAKALGADSTFGAAGLGLAMANSWTVINEHYGIGRDAAIRNISSMSERDRLFTRAFFGPDPALGPPEPAPVYLTRWEDLVEKYPDWTEAWYQLGDRYYHFGGLSGLGDADERARYAFRRALAQDSTFAAPLHHLVELYAARGERDELRAAGERYFAANPAVSRDRSAIGWEIAMALGDSAWLRRVRASFDSMPREELTRIAWVTDLNGWPRTDAERAVRLVDRKSGTPAEHEKAATSLFSLSVNAGDEAEARVAAAALGAQFPDRPVAALWDMFGALFAWNDTALANDAAARLRPFADAAAASDDHVRRDQHHLAACMSGYYHATRGELALARSYYERVSADLRGETNNFAKRNGTVCLAMLDAILQTATHATGATPAVARLDTILLRERVPPHVMLEAGTLVAARLHAQLGDSAAALVAARRREHLTGDPIFLTAERRLEKLLGGAEADARRQRRP